MVFFVNFGPVIGWSVKQIPNFLISKTLVYAQLASRREGFSVDQYLILLLGLSLKVAVGQVRTDHLRTADLVYYGRLGSCGNQPLTCGESLSLAETTFTFAKVPVNVTASAAKLPMASLFFEEAYSFPKNLDIETSLDLGTADADTEAVL